MIKTEWFPFAWLEFKFSFAGFQYLTYLIYEIWINILDKFLIYHDLTPSNWFITQLSVLINFYAFDLKTQRTSKNANRSPSWWYFSSDVIFIVWSALSFATFPSQRKKTSIYAMNQLEARHTRMKRVVVADLKLQIWNGV